MNKLSLFIISLLFFSCKKENQKEALYPQESKTIVEQGQEIFEGKGNCMSCHQIENELIAPSLKTISKIYKAKNGNMVLFLQNQAAPIVDPSQFEIMKTNFEVTKTLSLKELKALESYIYSK